MDKMLCNGKIVEVDYDMEKERVFFDSSLDMDDTTEIEVVKNEEEN